MAVGLSVYWCGAQVDGLIVKQPGQLFVDCRRFRRSICKIDGGWLLPVRVFEEESWLFLGNQNTSTGKTRIQRANERKIIDAAIELFGRHGLRGTTLDQIATRAKLSKPNLLYYFSSKQELYVVALGYVLDWWLLPLEALDPEGSPRDELGKYIDQKMQMSRDFPQASRMYAMEVIDGARILMPLLETRLADATKVKKRVLAKWMREGKIKKVDGFHLLFMIWATTQHYADFEVQIDSLTGKTLQNDTFYKNAQSAVKDIIFGGICND